MAKISGVIEQYVLPQSGTLVERVPLYGGRVGKRLKIGPNSNYRDLGLKEIFVRPGFKNLPGPGLRVNIIGTMFHKGNKVPGVMNLPIEKFKQIMNEAKRTGVINLF